MLGVQGDQISGWYHTHKSVNFFQSQNYYYGQGRIQELARGVVQTGRWLGTARLSCCCIFEVTNNHSVSLLISILAFADGCEVLKAV